jgi:hypothetical protein
MWRRCVSLAIAEAAIGSEYPHYRLDPLWEKGALFTRDNGSSDEYAIAFVKSGVFIRGFDHTSPMSPYRSDDGQTIWPGMYAAVPKSMQDLIADKRVTSDRFGVSYCITYSLAVAKWTIGVKTWPKNYTETPGDGSRWMLGSLAEGARQYVDWAGDYYGRSIALEPVATIFAHGELADDLLLELNPRVEVAKVKAFATAAHYGMGGVPPF